MKCRVVIPVNGVKRNSNGQIALKKRFKANSIVDGRYVRHGLLPENSVTLFMTKEGFLIPPHCLMEVKNVKYAEFDEAEEVKKDAYYDKEKIEEIKDKGILNIKDIVKDSKMTSKYVIQGAVGGGLIMLIFAMYKGYNKYLLSALGIVGGGFVGNLYKKHIV